MRTLTRLSALAVLVLTLGACTEIDNFLASIPTFTFMHESPAFDPYESPRPPPENAVPFAAPGGAVALPPLPEVSSETYLLERADELGTNPIPATDETLAAGQELYLTYCSVCHGPTGGGDGTVAANENYPLPVPGLATPAAADRSDGYIYAIIRAGRGLMPAYATQTTHRERWLIVSYVRRLQEQGTAQAGDGAGPSEGGE